MAMFAAPWFTIADLDRFPGDGNRYELLGGQLLVTPAPGPHHQVVLGRLTMRLAGYLGPDGPAVIVTPGVIQLEDHTQLEPDLLVIPASLADEASWRRIAGWWLAVEVSGRDSMVYDRDFKRDAYLRLGVREVWRVDLPTGGSIGPGRARHRRCRSRIACGGIRPSWRKHWCWRRPPSSARIEPDRRTGGRADGRTGGRADGRTGGRADGRTGGRADRTLRSARRPASPEREAEGSGDDPPRQWAALGRRRPCRDR